MNSEAFRRMVQYKLQCECECKESKMFDKKRRRHDHMVTLRTGLLRAERAGVLGIIRCCKLITTPTSFIQPTEWSG